MRDVLLRDTWIALVYWVITGITVTGEVKLNSLEISKWTFIVATLVFAVLVVANHSKAGQNQVPNVKRPLFIAAGVACALVGILFAVVLGTNLKFMLGGKL